jgi:hypothetical protein
MGNLFVGAVLAGAEVLGGGGVAVDVPGVAVAVDELTLLAREELLYGVQTDHGQREGHPQVVGRAVVKADCLENDREDQQLQRALAHRTHLNDQLLIPHPHPPPTPTHFSPTPSHFVNAGGEWEGGVARVCLREERLGKAWLLL